MNCPTCGRETEDEKFTFPPRLHFRKRGKREAAEIIEENKLPLGDRGGETTYSHRRAKSVQRIPLVIVRA